MANRYAHCRDPDAELDFHDLGPLGGAEIKRRTVDFIKTSAKAGHARVRIVTGKGNRSADGPVVRPQVARTLRTLESEGVLKDYAPESLDRGGDGAFLITLR